MACSGLVILVLNATQAEAKRLVLNCQITKGASAERSPKILIDEDAGIVVYNFNESGFTIIARSQGCPGCYTNLDMKITMKNEKVLMAANDPKDEKELIATAFVMTKHDGKFVHSFVATSPLPDGNFLAVGHTLWGTCAKSPFD
jgi:hypothetical protein